MSRSLFQNLAAITIACTITGAGGMLATAHSAPTTPAEEPAVLAVRKVMDAVVNINTEHTVRRRVYDPYEQFYYEYFRGRSAPRREMRQKVYNLGSGFLIDASGFIVTNHHVVQRASNLKISVTLADGKDYDAVYIAGDAETDLALIKITRNQPFPFISLEAPSPNLLGQTVLALGNPLGYGHSVSRGILSAKERTVVVGEIEYDELIQTDVAINPGNSGGPVIDLAGNLVGVSSVKLAYTPDGVPAQGLGFAISAEKVARKIQQLRQTRAPRAEAISLSERLFGIQVQDLTPEIAEALGYPPTAGALISMVTPGSAFAEAGIKRGLVIYGIGRYDITSARQVEERLDGVTAGDRVGFSVGPFSNRRGGRPVSRNFTLTAR